MSSTRWPSLSPWLAPARVGQHGKVSKILIFWPKLAQKRCFWFLEHSKPGPNSQNRCGIVQGPHLWCFDTLRSFLGLTIGSREVTEEAPRGKKVKFLPKRLFLVSISHIKWLKCDFIASLCYTDLVWAFGTSNLPSIIILGQPRITKSSF